MSTLIEELSAAIDRVLELTDKMESGAAMTQEELDALEEADTIITKLLRLAFGEEV